MLKILQIISRSNCDSGGGLQALELAKGLRERGHEVWFAARPGGSAQERCKGIGVPFFPLPMRGNVDMASVAMLRGFMREKRIEVVHAHKGLSHTLSLLAVCGMQKPPVVVANRGVSFSLSFWNRWKYLMPWTRGIVAVSAHVKDVLMASGVPAQKIRVIYGGVDVGRFIPMRREEACRSLGLDPSLDYVAMVAQFRPWKGHNILAQAVAQLTHGYPKLRVLLAGKTRGSTYKAFRSQVHRMGIGDRFFFLGYRGDVEVIMGASHFLVAPSTEGEGLPGVFRESMACARPVVASDVAGAPEVVIPHETGLLVPPNDAHALAQAIKSLLNSEMAMREMGMKGRALVEKRFTHGHRALIMEEYYKGLLEGA